MKLYSILLLAGGVFSLPTLQQGGKGNATSSCDGEKTAQLVAGINANLMIQAQELQGLVYFRPRQSSVAVHINFFQILILKSS